MSKFFNVTLDSKVTLDDSITNDYTGWTSEKILREILAHRITKLESLDDVDVINKQDKQILMYSSDTQKFITTSSKELVEGAGIGLNQIGKLGVVGSTSVPKIVDIPISSVDFKFNQVNVLKFKPGDQNVIRTQTSFLNSDSGDFVQDDMVSFDGTTKLKTSISYSIPYVETINNRYNRFKISVDKSLFKSISNITVTETGVDEFLNLTMVPLDRILFPKGDINVSNAINFDSFTLTATPATNVKVICSVDGGITWKTFRGDHWENINPTPADVFAYGINVNTFNTINSTYWNLLITSGKIRFAYLLQDTNSLDELKFQYDGQGYWQQAKDTEYDVVYASNSLLQVKLYFSGDVKINY